MLKGSCKKISALVVISALCATFVPVSSLSAESADVDNYYTRIPSQREKALLSARDFAYEYLNNSREEPLWKDKSPYISSEKFFYTANDEIPSYIEFKVSTDENDDAGFIIVNLDENDVRVPLASPNGKTPSEALKNRLANNEGNQTGNKKLYYFSPFDQWLVNEQTGNAETLNPNNQEDESIKKSENTISERSAEGTKTILTEEGKQKQNIKFAEMKQNAKEFVKSAEFRERSARLRVSERATYVSPGLSNVTLPNLYKSKECTSAVPCYNSFNVDGCFSAGCAPIALGIVFGYYDRMGYPNLLKGIEAPRTNKAFPANVRVNSMITELRGFMKTGEGTASCDGTKPINLGLGMLYAKNQGYPRARINHTKTSNINIIYNAIKNEINHDRPVILLTSDHALVTWGYNSFLHAVRVNLGWGSREHMGYDASNVDMSLNAITYDYTTYSVQAYLTILMD